MLKRTLIRQAVVAILSDPSTALGNGSCATGLTAAMDRVYDSPADPLQMLGEDMDLPAIGVYTDQDDGDMGAGMSMNFSSHVEMVIHIEMYASASTDYATEALLDLMEAQVRRKVLYDSRLYRLAICNADGVEVGHEPLVEQVVKYQSARGYDASRQARVGMRRFLLTVRYVENCLPPEIVTGACMAPPVMRCMKSGVMVEGELVPFSLHYADVPVGIAVG